MKPTTHRALFWLAGPTIALALLTGLAAIGGGPGLSFLVVAASGLFLVAMPLLQGGLMALRAFDGQRAAIAIAAFLAIAAVVVLLAASGLFSFW